MRGDSSRIVVPVDGVELDEAFADRPAEETGEASAQPVHGGAADGCFGLSQERGDVAASDLSERQSMEALA